MAFANIFSSASTRPEEQLTTPIGTPPPTSGIQTPRPETHDKRFPTILSSYLSQVRDSFHPSTRPSARMASTSPHSPAPEAEGLSRVVSKMSLEASAGAGDATSTASHPTTEPPSHRSCPTFQDLMQKKAQHAYPTPPLSSASSSTKSNKNEHTSDASPGSLSPASAGARSPLRRQSALDSFPTNLRKTTPVAAPLSSTSTPNILASHISTPKTSNVEVSRSSVSASQQLSASLQTSEDKGLTEDAAQSRSQTPIPQRNPSPEAKQADPSSPKGPEESVPLERHGSTDDALMGHPRGKLTIKISSGRGLRPSLDPYVVCKFQYNEYISRGPRNDSGSALDTDGTADRFRDGGLHIKRTDSNNGRPMAIPMKSRQSSQTSMSGRDASRGREVTDPVWNHEAVL